MSTDHCTGLWYCFDYRCGSHGCIKAPNYTGASGATRGLPDLGLEWLGHIQLPDGRFNAALTIKGQFVDIALVIYDVQAPETSTSAGQKYPATRGRLPQWKGACCPYCDKLNPSYDPSRGDRRRHIRISHRVLEWDPPNVCVLRLDSEDAPEFWMEFEVPAWIASK